MSVTDRLLKAAFQLGPMIPEPLLRAGAAAAATGVWAMGGAGVRQLEKNLARVRPAGAAGLRRASRIALRHYFRYYAEALRLPALSTAQIDARVELDMTPAAYEDITTRTTVGALGHLGNWDLAGAFATRNLAHVATVAERLEPEDVYRAFLDLREGVGMQILPLDRGSGVFGQLVRIARGGHHFLPLLADRDLSHTGVPAAICGQPARVAAGPAALAATARISLYFVGIRHRRLHGQRRRAAGSPWGIVVTFRGPFTTTRTGADAVADLTEQWTAAFSDYLREYPLHWHMLQPVFDADLDLSRIRAKQGDAR